MHDVLSVAITVATILLASYFNQSAINSLRGEMNSIRGEMHSLRSELNGKVDSLRSELNGKVDSLRSELNGRIDSIQRDMREFYSEQARHDTRITALERTSDSR